MQEKFIFRVNGELYARMIKSGANRLWQSKKEINDLNVFPIPDGDTGDNMYMTVSGGVSASEKENSSLFSDVAAAVARGMLFGARGNSGVILSQFFEGIRCSSIGKNELDATEFADALISGVEKAYSSVDRPVEGTMLTVLKDGAEYARSSLSRDASIESLFKNFISEMNRSLKRTPELLPVLRDAGVVDSGGAGVLKIVEGMLGALLGEEYKGEARDVEVKGVDFSRFDENSEMLFGYCTEILLQLQKSKVDPESFDEREIVNYLETIGDSIVAVKTGSVIKLHVHTMKPYLVLEFCQKFGEYLTVKIENMTLQHNETDYATKKVEEKPRGKRKRFALVTVANGEGMKDVFLESGADLVIDGGQGKNPSVNDFIDAFYSVNADEIFVLPNNSNIIMAANSAASVYEDSRIYVIETKNFGEAYSILSMLDYTSADAEAIVAEMKENMKNVTTAMISSSVRDAVIDGVEVKNGEYIGFTDKKMLASESSLISVFKSLLEKLAADEKGYMVLFVGCCVGEDVKQAVYSYVESEYPALEFYPVEGGQDVYDFIMILE